LSYDYEKENFKTCPVCLKVIDYHVDGFFHDKVLNIWICRDHSLADILKVIGLRDPDIVRFILSDEISTDMGQFNEAYETACTALLTMSRVWEDPICADQIQEAMVGPYPEYLPSFDEFVHDFNGIFKRPAPPPGPAEY
jgi:hypothetical protein